MKWLKRLVGIETERPQTRMERALRAQLPTAKLIAATTLAFGRFAPADAQDYAVIKHDGQVKTVYLQGGGLVWLTHKHLFRVRAGGQLYTVNRPWVPEELERAMLQAEFADYERHSTNMEAVL